MKPTRIVEKPERVFAGRLHYLQIKCNDGKTYTLQELAATLPLDPSSLSNRIKKFGWNDPHILKRHRPQQEDDFYQESPWKTIVAGDLAHLSATHNRFKVRVYTDKGVPVRGAI